MSPNEIFWLLYTFYLGSFLWDFYLTWRQYQVYRQNKVRPEKVKEIISEEDYEKARNYKLDKMHFGFLSMAYGKMEKTIVLFCALMPWLWAHCGHFGAQMWPGSGEIIQSILYIGIFSVIETLTSMPFSYYDTFYIEQKHGFNKETISFFFKDRLKKFLLSMVISYPIVAAIIWIVHAGGPNFFVYAWAFISLIIFVFMFIYPEFIAPLFDKYTPLPDSELKTKIEELAARVSFPLTKIYVVEGSKRSSHSNAYMYGFWKNKRIVLYDTLLSKEMNEQLKREENAKKKNNGENDKKENAERDEEAKEKNDEEEEKMLNAEKEETATEGEEKKEGDEEAKEKNDEEEEKMLNAEKEETATEGEEKKQLGMANEEVVAVLGHELGHWKEYHTVCLLIATELNLLLMLFVFAFFHRQEDLFVAFGFPTSQQPVIIGLTLVGQYVLSPYNEFLSVAMSFVSRRFEFAADKFGAMLGYTRSLQTGLIKLGKDNLSLPIDDWLYSACNHSHPPILERIEALKKYE